MNQHLERTGIQHPGEGTHTVAGEELIGRGNDSRVSLRLILLPGICFLAGFLYILGGLVWRQVLNSADFDDEFRIQSTRVIQLPAPRGNIYDRNGKLIVGNSERFNIVADLGMLREEIYREFKDSIRKTTFSKDRLERLREIGVLKEKARITVLQRYLNRLNRVMKRKGVVDPAALRRHIKSNLALDFPLVSDISRDEVALFVENFPEKSPLRLYVDSIRKYEFGDSAAHVLGYLSNSDDFGDEEHLDPEVKELLHLRRERDRKADSLFIKYPGKIGKAGLELACDDQLRGKPGSQVWMVDPTGYLYKRLSENRPEQGAHVYCSLDIDLQKTAEDALANKTGASGQYRGAAIAIDVGTGEILALASFPRYDPNEFADVLTRAYQKKMREEGSENNLATQGVYPPGSTFKVISAIAGMRSGKLKPDEVFQCGPSYDVGGRHWKEHDGASFGEVDLVKMLRVSCNVYCYQLGELMGIAPLAAEAKRFGLDKKIIIEPAERLPDGRLAAVSTANLLTVPDPAWKIKNGYSGWSTGDTMNTVIGQGYLGITPLHMAAMIASVAADRTHTKLSLLHDPAKDGLRLDNASHGAEPIGLTAYQRQRLIDGLRACVQSDERGSTGKPVRVTGVDIVGKTGTAEFKDKKRQDVNLAWFEGFAPGDNPQIAVCVMIEGEHGGPRIHGGSHAGPVARAIFAKWREKQQKPE